jgi:DNA-binding FadR family transcriptional regulator
MEKLDPVSSVTLADAVEQKIYSYISSNKMLPGDPLPKEEDLAKSLNVSRNIVREALSRLRMLGLVETRKKKGMTLAQPDAFIGLEKMISTGMMSDSYRRDILDMRIILELGMCDYVYRNKTEENISELETISNRKAGTEAEINEVEVAFHSKLYKIAGNEVLGRLQGILKPFFKIVKHRKDRPKPTVSSPDHKDICKVLRNGTADEFREIMHEHLKVYLD